MEETVVINPNSKVLQMLDDLKHMYGAEKSIRGRVLLSDVLRILENYSQMPNQDASLESPVEKWEQASKMKMSPKGKVAFVRNIAVQQRVVRIQGSGCLWCGSKRIKEFVKYPKEGFNGFECLDCKEKFYR